MARLARRRLELGLDDVAVARVEARAARVEDAAARRIRPATGRRRRRRSACALVPVGGQPRHGGDQPAPCRGAEGARRSSRDSASSTTRPRYITAMRVQICRITDRSCEMKTYVRSNSFCSARSRFRICACTETSSAETGSSQTISFGLQREGARDADPLSLAARELVRVPAGVLAAEADDLEQRLDAELCLALAHATVNRERLARRSARRSCAG